MRSRSFTVIRITLGGFTLLKNLTSYFKRLPPYETVGRPLLAAHSPQTLTPKLRSKPTRRNPQRAMDKGGRTPDFNPSAALLVPSWVPSRPNRRHQPDRRWRFRAFSRPVRERRRRPSQPTAPPRDEPCVRSARSARRRS